MSSYLIFGGTGLIGSAIAARLRDDGADVTCTYLTRPEVVPMGCRALRCDVTRDGIEEALNNTLSVATHLDGVVYAIGSVRRRVVDIVDITGELLDQMYITHVRAPFVLCRYICSHTREFAGSSVVLLSSVIASRGHIRGSGVHAAMTAAVERLVTSEARTLARQNVRLNAVAPGYIYGGPNEPGERDVLQELRRMTPLNRPGESADVASAIRYLLSKEASFVTGSVLAVDGGLFR